MLLPCCRSPLLLRHCSRRSASCSICFCGRSSSSQIHSVSDDSDRIEETVGPTAVTITYRDVVNAYDRIKNNVDMSPLHFSHYLSAKHDCQLYLKKEHVSRTGSYKERGALNKLLTLTDQEKQSGVVCSSAGNHAQAVSFHATRLGINSIIVMPETTPHVKVKSTREFGGKVILHGSSFAEAYEKALEIAEQDGRTFVHAFNDPAIVAGQGTVALELLKQNPYLDSVVVPIGGGGLIAGMATVLKHVNPRIKVFGVEAEAMPGMKKSVAMGRVVSVPKNRTLSDGIAIEQVGQIPFDVIKHLVDDVAVVNESEVAASILALLEKEKTVTEGSGATALAAIAYGHVQVKGHDTACVLTGSNIDMTVLSRIIEKGLVRDGRIARMAFTIDDAPGNLSKILNILSDTKANVRDVNHERAFLLSTVMQTKPILTLDTRGAEHIEEIVLALRRGGFDPQVMTESN